MANPFEDHISYPVKSYTMQTDSIEDDIAYYEREVEKFMVQTVESSDRCVASLTQAEAAGVRTAEDILLQREKLERAERNLDVIHTTTQATQRNLNSLKSFFGGFFRNKFSRKSKPTLPVNAARADAQNDAATHLATTVQFIGSADYKQSLTASAQTSSGAKDDLPWAEVAAELRAYTPTKKEQYILNNVRVWAEPNVAHLNARVSSYNRITIDWPEHPDRNIHIAIKSAQRKDFYVNKVKSILYAIVWAMHHDTKCVSVANDSSLLTDVIQGRKRARTEVDQIKKIKAAINSHSLEPPIRAAVVFQSELPDITDMKFKYLSEPSFLSMVGDGLHKLEPREPNAKGSDDQET